MKNKDNGLYFHNIIIVGAITIFSLLCWVSFIGNFAPAVLQHIIPKGETVYAASAVLTDAVVPVSSAVLSDAVTGSDGNTEIFDAIDTYINKFDTMWSESIVKKSKLTVADSLYTYFTTGEIASSQVVEGSDGCLYYISTTDGNSVADFEGTNRYTESEMAYMLNGTLALQEELNARGIKFALLAAPNKENVYAEYMPDSYTHAELSSTDILVDYLSAGGVNAVNPKQELVDEHDDFSLYYHYDTHWNQLGAYIGTRSVLGSWGIEIPSLSKRTISSYSLADNYHYGALDDLAQLVGLRDLVFTDDTEYEVDGTFIIDWDKYEDEQLYAVTSHFSNPDALTNTTLLLAGDSFRSAMIPSLVEAFSDVYVINRGLYTSNILDEINPEYLLLEYVERYSGDIEDIADFY